LPPDDITWKPCPEGTLGLGHTGQLRTGASVLITPTLTRYAEAEEFRRHE